MNNMTTDSGPPDHALAHWLPTECHVKTDHCMNAPGPRWLSWMRRPTRDHEVAGSTPAEVGNILSWRLIICTVILSLPLIQEGQLSVSGERMCTILVNRLED